MQIIELDEIKKLVADVDLIPTVEAGFAALSAGRANVPPVGELQLEQGEVHIKYGAIRSQPFFVIKIASGFYGNADLGLSTSNGCMLVFCQNTGQLECILLDEGYLTDVRTAVAGAIAAKYLAPRNVTRIGIVGTGIQARMQLRYLQTTVGCRDVLVWGRSQINAERYRGEFMDDPDSEYIVEVAESLSEIQTRCNLIVTTTPTKTPLLSAQHLARGTHITAVGSDTPEKQELDSTILAEADMVVADSISQCRLRGEISQALRGNKITPDSILELGDIVSGESPRRANDEQTTVADLTGVAVQDIQIASATLAQLRRQSRDASA